MPQKTNLNINPYYDDFDKAKNFYKILFRPGHPVQARELTGLQSILQNQVESFGKHIFKEGSMVIPGGIEYDASYFSCKVNSSHLGIDVSVYLNNIISNNDGKGTRVRGQNSGIVGTIKNFILPPEEGVDEITIFVKYNQSGTDGESTGFPNNEVLELEEPLTYGNTTLTSNDTILTLVSENASATGSAFGVNKGVYFVRGTFVDVPTSLIVLEPYNNEPSYRVGFEVIEEVVSAGDDDSLYDNAKGFTNFAAPGADRFKITVKLSKKSLQDFNDTNFVELFRVSEGETKKLQNTSVYSEIKKYFAKRTFDESGNYAVEPFRVNTQNSLNDEISSRGLYTSNQLTDQGNTPSEDLMCVKLSPGKAYVRGFDVYLPGTTVVDVEKPRDVKSIGASSIPFTLGSNLKVNNVFGTPYISLGGTNNNTIDLYNRRGLSGGLATDRGIKIGQARVYSYGASDALYTGNSTEFDLHLYDIQTYTTLKLSDVSMMTAGSRVRGIASGASGFVADTNNNPNERSLLQTSGTFLEGEQVIVDEKISNISPSIVKIDTYTVDDIKSVYQSKIVNAIASNFSADTVLYDRVLPYFSITDSLSVVGGAQANTATVASRRFSGKVGIKTDTIIAYSKGQTSDPVYNRVSDISADGSTLTLVAVGQSVPNVNFGGILAAGISTESTFRIKVPQVTNIQSDGLFSRLPKTNISIIDTSNSNLIISRQLLNQTITQNTITVSSQVGLAATVGITSAFFEPFDAEKYSIHYTDGTTEKLNSGQVSISNNGNDITFSGLSKATGNATVNVTLKKIGVTSKTKIFSRSNELEITRSTGISTANSDLIGSSRYGLRVEDEEISLNTPDVVNVVAVYESKNKSKPVLDKLTFVSGLNLNTNAIVGEKIIGQDSRAVGQVVSRTTNTISFVYLNANKFVIGEQIKFEESAIESVLQGITTGNYVDRTNNYNLDKGHKLQYCDYSKIVRKSKSAVPSKKLLIIFDKYEVPIGVTGDLFSVNSYTSDRYSKDIPAIGENRASDVLDFRPRVVDYNVASTSGSPFSFNNRAFTSETPFIVTPNESSILGYSFYLPRIDKLVINQFEEVKLIKGESAEEPVPPTEFGDAMEVAEITLPPYLYDTAVQPDIRMKDNRRFTMRDIGALERRIINLETTTTLNALELDTKSLQVRDADGLDRFKSGFAVNNFKDRSFINFDPEEGSRCDVDTFHREMITAVDFWSMRAELALDPAIDLATSDLNSNLRLLDPNCKKTGDLVTLDYTEIDWIDQPQATEVENVNPFNVIVFAGVVFLDPPSDNWSRTIYIENVRTESTGNRWVEQANIVSRTKKTETDVRRFDNTKGKTQTGYFGKVTTITTRTRTEREFVNVLKGSAEEYNYIEDVKVTSEADPYMRSRNVQFYANGLKPHTKHYHYLDNGTPDIVPKLIEISMSAGSFVIFENAKILLNGEQIGYIRIQKPNHKFGDNGRPDVAAGLGSPSVTVEEYTVDPYDRSRPAPASTYSATSQLLNVDVVSLGNLEEYFGYVVKGAQIVGETSGAVASVTNIDLFSDNWGDLLGAFFFRNANAQPEPPVVFRSCTKTFRVTAAPEGVIPAPGQTALASDASGTFTGTGTIITQNNFTVAVRNPPPPAQRRNEVTVSVNTRKRTDRQFFYAGHRDPLAQSFTVDETGAFLTSFDVYFKSKDPLAKLFVELRHVELGTPTNLLVQDYTQLAINPSQINVSDDASVPTTISFSSPVYLEPKKEYAIVFLSPASDKYEMWVATMGQKTVKTSTLPDVENVVVSKQYIGGSLFKSQNGTIWTPSQYQDLTFKLRKASFVQSGTATFYNSPIEPGNLNTQFISSNALRSLPRKLRVQIEGTGARTNSEFPIGRKVSTNTGATSDDNNIIGVVEGRGSRFLSNTSFEIISRGSGYSFTPNGNNIPLVSLTGSGSGSQCSVTVSTVNGVPGVVDENGISNLTLGNGYQIGEVLTIDNSSSAVTGGSGFKMVVKEIFGTFDSLFLTDVQGEKFDNGATLVHYGAGNNTRTVANNVTVVTDGSSVNGTLYTGNKFEITQYNHAHHSGNNQVHIKNVQPDTPITQIIQDIAADTTVVSVADTSAFTSYNGITTHKGEAIIGSEIVSYTIGTGQLTIDRGQVNTTAITHPSGTDIQTYEASGISLVGINTTFTVSTDARDIDTYYVEVNRALFTDPQRSTGVQQLSFTNEKAFGGSDIQISQNHQFSTLSPQFNCITPGKTTKVNASVRTVTGTSSGGTEVSFIDQGFEPTALNETTFFPTPRLVASKVNEDARLASLPKKKSLTLSVEMSSEDSNLSPVLDTKNATFILGRNKINNPVSDYATDSRTNQLKDDPHGSIFVSSIVNLQQPATSLKVLLGASVEPDADFRVFYRLFSSDSSEVSQSYRPFPGYKNLNDTNGDGFGDDIIDLTKNDGRADAFVEPNRVNEFSEYQFSVDNLEQFDAFAIKIVMSSTNESQPVKFKDFRAIALA